MIYKSLGPPITTDIDVAKKVSKYIAIDIDIRKISIRKFWNISILIKYCINENLAYRTSLLRHVEGRPQRVVLYSLTFIMYLSLDLIGNFNRALISFHTEQKPTGRATQTIMMPSAGLLAPFTTFLGFKLIQAKVG